MALDDEDLFDAPRPKPSNKIVYQPPGAQWSLDRLPEVESIYQSSFKKRLPLVNKGQGGIHNKWGYDHRNSADVSINPSTPEGQQFIEQLKKANVPFLAFNAAIPGVATGPHVHIGFPSKRTQQKFGIGAQKKSKTVASDDLFDTDDDLFDSSGQTPPSSSPELKTQTAKRRQPATSTATSPAEAQSVPTIPIEQALQRLTEQVNRATGIKTAAPAPPMSRGELLQSDEQQLQRARQRVDTEHPEGRFLPYLRARQIAQTIADDREEELRQRAEQPRLDALVAEYRQQIRQTGLPQWLAEATARGGAGVGQLVAAAGKGFSRFARNPQQSRARVDEFALHAKAMEQAAVAEGADRNVVSRLVQDAVAGGIATAPELAAMSAGAPAPAVFAAGSAARSYGRGESAAQIAKSAQHGLAQGLAFELPVPKGVTSAARRVATKAGTVGAATTGIELAAGATPQQALSSGITNAAFAGHGELARGGAPITSQRLGEIAAAAGPRGDVAESATPNPLRNYRRRYGREVQDETQPPPVEAQRAEVESIQTPTQPAAEPSTVERSVQRVVPVESETTETPQRFYHRDFGEVRKTEDQSGARTGRTRVQEVDDPEKIHYVKTAQLTGRGNERMVPVKPAIEPEPEAESAPVESPILSEQAAPPAPVKPITVSEPAPPSLTSGRKQMMRGDRAELDLPELPAAERKSWRTSLDNAKPEDANRLADEVLNKPRALNDEETASLVVRAQQIKNEHAQVMKEIGDAQGNVLTSKRQQAESLEAEFDKLTQATKASGTEKGRTLAAQKLTINQDYDLVSLIQRAKAAKGRDLTPEERARYEKMAGEIESLNKRLTEANEKLAQKNLQKQVDRISRQRQRQEKKETLDDEFAALKLQFAKARAEVKNVQASGLAGIDPEGTLTKIVVKMAHNRARRGTVDAQALVSEIYNAIKEHAEGITERDVRDAISGYSIAPKETRSELQKKLDALRSELQQLSKQEDIEVGIRSPRREGPKPSEARALPMEGPRMSEERSSGIPRQGPKLSDIRRVPQQGPRQSEARRSGQPLQGPKQSEANKLPMEGPKITDAPKVGPKETVEQIRKRINAQIAEYERRLNERDFSDRPKRAKVIDTAETRALRERLEATKNQFNRELERERSGRWWRNLSGMRKAWLLSGPLTHVRNIVGTVAYQPFDEFARLPAVVVDAALSKATGQRGIQGPSPAAMLDSVVNAVRQGGTEAKSILKHGATAEDLARHQFSEIDTGVKAIDLAHNAIFRFMSASDRVSYQGAYKRNLIDRASIQAKNEKQSDPAINVRERSRELIEDPPDELRASAEHDALVNTFNNSNKLSDAIKRGRSALSPQANFAIDLVMPFDRTPTNVIARVLEASPYGYARNAKQLAQSIIKKSMSVEEQRAFSQTFGRATTGTALMALGFALAGKGVLTWEDKRKSVFLQLGERKINISALSPIGSILAVGAGLYRERGSPKGQVKAALAPVAEQPLIRGVSDLGSLITDSDRSLPRIGGRFASSFIPFSGAVRTAAQALDPKERKATTFTQNIQQNIPGLRNRLPENTEFERKKAKASFTDRLRANQANEADLEVAKQRGEITESDIKRIRRDAGMTPEQVSFTNLIPSTALDRYERMSEAQRAQVREIMARKAYTLQTSEALTDAQKESFQKRIDALGVSPDSGKKTKGFSSGFKGAFKSQFAR